MGAYHALSAGYDKLNSETDYVTWAAFISECFKRRSIVVHNNYNQNKCIKQILQYCKISCQYCCEFRIQESKKG